MASPNRPTGNAIFAAVLLPDTLIEHCTLLNIVVYRTTTLDCQQQILLGTVHQHTYHIATYVPYTNLRTLIVNLQTGDRLTGGDIYATVQENSLLEHRMMLPPGARGNVTYIAPAGEYSLTDKVIEVEFGGVKKVCAPCVGFLYTCH